MSGDCAGRDGIQSEDASRADVDLVERLEQLRVALDNLALKPVDNGPRAPLEYSRADTIAVLDCLYRALHRLFAEPQVDPDELHGDDLLIFIEHPAWTVLRCLASSLRDLDNSNVTPAILLPSPGEKGPALLSAEMTRRTETVALLEAVKAMKDHTSWKAAADDLERMMVNTVGRDHATPAKTMLEWRKPRSRRREVKSSD